MLKLFTVNCLQSDKGKSKTRGENVEETKRGKKKEKKEGKKKKQDKEYLKKL